MKLSYFTRSFVQRLRQAVPDNVERYGSGESWDAVPPDDVENVKESGQVVGPPPILLTAPEGNPALDAENARRVFMWLETLTPALAMEERLWSYLTHCTFRDYMAARWPASGATTILRRYFLDSGAFSALSRNGIARLWWAGYLTRESERENPFELTDTLFYRQDIQVALLERSLGKCRAVRIAVLEYLRENTHQDEQSELGRRIQVMVRELNLLGGVVVLDALAPAAIKEHLAAISARYQPDN